MQETIDRGLMFAEPRELDHDGWVSAARSAASNCDAGEVAESFLASLTSRRLDLRSALASYVFARHLPQHEYVTGSTGLCLVCGLPQSSSQDLNVLNFERHKWGGVRRDDVRYVALDLEQFARAPKLDATAEDRALAAHLFEVLGNLTEQDSATTAVARLVKVKGNKAEREVLLDILGICGVLSVDGHSGYRHGYVAYEDREVPSRRFVDRAYPVCWWTGRDGVDAGAVGDYFPSCIQ